METIKHMFVARTNHDDLMGMELSVPFTVDTNYISFENIDLIS